MCSMASHAVPVLPNMLLAALPSAEWEQVRRNLKPIFMPVGDLLYEPAMPIRHIHFPTTSVISISCVLADGRSDAVALIGPEGFVSVEGFLSSDTPLCRAVVLSEGWGYRIRRELLNRECGQGGSLHGVLLRYAQSYITQVAQTSVCNRRHSIDQQLCRWLLMFLDRQVSNDLPITHEHIAELMGVRRESVTEAAHKLQIAGCIRYRRGHISVLDRSGLEAHSCECYGIVKREADRLLEMSRRSAKAAAAQVVACRIRKERSDSSFANAWQNIA